MNVLVRKSDRVLELYDDGVLIKSYAIVLGFAPVGDKEVEGDGRTPEGEFYVFTKNRKSKFHLSLGLSYPAKEDARRGFERELISGSELDEIEHAIDNRLMPPQKTALGGEIYIHGGGIDNDWTEGCIALRNEEIVELFESIPLGTSVKIVP